MRDQATGRPTGRTNRDLILQAARQELAEHGYEGASLRGIARRAHVDIRLVHHYFGRKNRLARAATETAYPPVAADSEGTNSGSAALATSPGTGTGTGPVTDRQRGPWTPDRLTWRALIAAAMTHPPTASQLARRLAALPSHGSPRTSGLPPASGPGELRQAALASQILGLAVIGQVLARTGTRQHEEAVTRVMDSCLRDHLGRAHQSGPDRER